MYGLKNLADKNPTQVSAAAVAVLNLLIIIGVLAWSPEAVAGANVALVAVLGLFVSSRTVNEAKLKELGDAGAGELSLVLLVLIAVGVALLVFGVAPW